MKPRTNAPVFQALVRSLPVLTLLAAMPLGTLANTVKDDVWRVTSVKVNGQDAIPNGLNNWKGPAGGPDTVNVEVVWEPGNGPWSHLADMCDPTHSPEPDAYIGVLGSGGPELQGQAQMIGLSTEKFTYTFSNVPKNSEFHVWIKCDAPLFQPGTELLATFAFIDLKYKISVSAETIEQGGFDPYGAPEAGGVEIDMPGDPGKFPAGTPKEYAIFVKAITANPPQKIRGQFQKAVDYQVGGYVGDLAIPSDKIYVTQWGDYLGPISSPTDWDSLAYGGPSTIKGVMTEMGEGAQFGPGIYRMRVRAEDGEMQNWSDWWQFWVGNPTSLKSQMISKVNPELIDKIQGDVSQGNGNGDGNQMSMQFGDKASEIKSQLGNESRTGKLEQLSQGGARTQALGEGTDLAGALRDKTRESPVKKAMSMEELSRTRSAIQSTQSQAMRNTQDPADKTKMAKLGKAREALQPGTQVEQASTQVQRASTQGIQLRAMKASVQGTPRAGQIVRLQVKAPHDAGDHVSVHCVSGGCAGQKWTQNMGSMLMLPREKFSDSGNYTLKLQSGAYSTQVSFLVSPSREATRIGNGAMEMKNVDPRDAMKVERTGGEEKEMQSIKPQKALGTDSRAIMMQAE